MKRQDDFGVGGALFLSVFLLLWLYYLTILISQEIP